MKQENFDNIINWDEARILNEFKFEHVEIYSFKRDNDYDLTVVLETWEGDYPSKYHITLSFKNVVKVYYAQVFLNKCNFKGMKVTRDEKYNDIVHFVLDGIHFEIECHTIELVKIDKIEKEEFDLYGNLLD